MGRAFPYKSFQVRPAENKQRPLRMSHYRSANMIRPSRRTGRDIAEPAPVPLPLEDARHHDVAGSPLHSRSLGLLFLWSQQVTPAYPPLKNAASKAEASKDEPSEDAPSLLEESSHPRRRLGTHGFLSCGA